MDKEKKILITGHRGFLGSQIAREFPLAQGWDVKDQASHDINNFIPGRFDVVINCAAEMFDKHSMVWTNVSGTNNLIEMCQKWNAKLIHFSTVGIYGNGLYGLTKKMAEDLIKQQKPLDYCILRMTNLYGDGGSSPACRFEMGEQVIFGDGSHVKDHLHVRDVVTAVKMAIDDNWTGEVNLSSGVEAPISTVYELFGRGKPTYLKDKKPDIEQSTLDNSSAIALGWEPTWNIYDRR